MTRQLKTSKEEANDDVKEEQTTETGGSDNELLEGLNELQ